MITALSGYFATHQDEILKEFFTFLTFQSVSTEPEYKQELLDCCRFVADKLVDIGFTVEVWEAERGHPCIFAENLDAGPGKPTLLIYNHYDVQPVDPENLWHSPPFEPTIRDGEVYARGAQDNKGQCFYTLKALEYIMKTEGRLPINVKLIIEGEEEAGSDALSLLLPKKKEQLQSDYLAIVDSGIHSLDKPQVSLGVRGIAAIDVELIGSSTDLHSGSHGGIVYNPNRALVEMLGKLYDSEGRVTVPGFYDDVKEFDAESKKLISLDFDHKAYKQSFGADATGGETNYTPYERAWVRPTLEINGVSGGYAGDGFKTVIPAKARAKLSLRLVPDQDPHKLGQAVVDALVKSTPEGIECRAFSHGVGRAVRSDPNSPVVQAFAAAYSAIFGKPCGFSLDGGSIPITAELQKACGGDVVIVGLGLPEDNIHAPNEHFGVRRLKIGMQLIVKTLHILGEQS